MTTIIFIDTYARRLAVYTCAATKTQTGGLVLRFGGDIGNLADIAPHGAKVRAGMPVLLPVRGYKACQSAGFVEVVAGYLPRQEVVGIQGMPFMRGTGSLRPIAPMEVVCLPPEAMIAALRCSTNSNWASAAAADAAVRLRSRIRLQSVFLTEGQSDWLRAWEIGPEPGGGLGSIPEFPEEFRSDMFTPD